MAAAQARVARDGGERSVGAAGILLAVKMTALPGAPICVGGPGSTRAEFNREPGVRTAQACDWKPASSETIAPDFRPGFD